MKYTVSIFTSSPVYSNCNLAFNDGKDWFEFRKFDDCEKEELAEIIEWNVYRVNVEMCYNTSKEFRVIVSNGEIEHNITSKIGNWEIPCNELIKKLQKNTI